MPMQLITPPAAEPVSLAEAKHHLRVDFDEDDALIQALICAARQSAEMLTQRQLVTARWRMVLNALTRIRYCTPDGKLEFDTKDGSGVAPPGHLAWFDVPSVLAVATPPARRWR